MDELSTSRQTPAANMAVKDGAYPYAPQPATIPRPAPYEPDWPDSLEAHAWFPLTGVYVACLGFNFLMPVVISNLRPEPNLLVAVAFGTFASQLAALCALVVFGEWNFWGRVAAIWAIGYSLGLAFLFGIGVSEGPPDLDEVVLGLFCALPLVMLAAQLPLWAARFYFGWQVRRRQSPAEARPLSIGDIFCGTAVAAVTVGLVRFVPAGASGPDLNFWIGWAVAVPSIAGISLIAVLPAMYLVLRQARPAAACLLLGGYAMVAAAATLMVITTVGRQRLDDELLVLFPVGFVTFAMVLFGMLWLVRSCGYRLLFAGERVVLESSPPT
jgi:hypothetical protein